MNITKGFTQVAKAQVERFRPYCHEHPIVMSPERYQSLKQLGLILYRAIRELALHYETHSRLMPLSDRDREVLRVCDPHPFRVGTFRTDFVIDSSSHIKIIEITTRQPLNGYFISGFSNIIGQEMARKLNLKGIIDDYPRLLDYLGGYFGDVRHICVIRGNERMGEFKIYPSIFEAAGIPCHVIPLAEVSDKLALLRDAAVIEELNHREIRELPDPVIEALTAARIHNDFRNIFVAHDKRFFSLLSNPLFLSKILNETERELLRSYLVPTYSFGEERHLWTEAYKNKNPWILKHRVLGKSEKVYAGEVTEEQVWKSLFDSGEVTQMVMQPFLPQRRFKGMIGSEERSDYVAGTLLYFNEEFFGPGIYRASSFPVSNQGDDRKLAQLVAIPPPDHSGVHVL
jgi:hypothetical protein